MPPSVLSIAGSDPSGGAGIQADLKTFSAHKVYGMAIPTLITVQNSCGVESVHPLPAELVAQQLRCVLDDIKPSAIKIGALGTQECILVIAEILSQYAYPIILDPILFSSSGKALLAPNAQIALIENLLPICTLITPNQAEYAHLFPDTKPACFCLRTDGDQSDSPLCTERLIAPNGEESRFTHLRLSRRNTHGTGCTLSSAIAAQVALGNPIPKACQEAIGYVYRLLEKSDQYNLGKGHGALGHEFSW